MRGRDYFPNHREYAHAYDTELRRWKERATIIQGRNFEEQPVTPDEFDSIAEPLQRRLAQQMELDEQQQNRVWEGVPALNLNALPDVRKDPMPPFKLPYQTGAEIKMRFGGTVICIKGHPFLVKDTRELRNRELHFLLENPAGALNFIPVPEVPCFRGPQPKYVNISGQPGYFYRTTARTNQQGLTTNNCNAKSVGRNGFLLSNSRQLLQSLKPIADIRWDDTLSRLMDNGSLNSLRLTDNVAVYADINKKDGVYVEYKQRSLGKLVEDCVVFHDPDDNDPPWIAQHLREAGLKGRVA